MSFQSLRVGIKQDPILAACSKIVIYINSDAEGGIDNNNIIRKNYMCMWLPQMLANPHLRTKSNGFAVRTPGLKSFYSGPPMANYKAVATCRNCCR